jgi:hypothetical protein
MVGLPSFIESLWAKWVDQEQKKLIATLSTANCGN